MSFGTEEESHAHSLLTLNQLEGYNTFMESIDTLCDMGCGLGKDLEWWATRAIEDDEGNDIPLDIKCTGVDIRDRIFIDEKYDNIEYVRHDFETEIKNRRFDVIWSHDSFQYAINPVETLRKWWHLLNDNGMLAITVPSTTEVQYQRLHYTQHDYQYHHFTTVSLLHMLSVNGFDCAFMKKDFDDPWIRAVVYKSEHEPMDPRHTRWYHIAEKGLLPESAVKSINKYGYLRQQDLVLEWLDHSLRWYGDD
jgi:SAM-dependent methyltransferase